MSLGWYSGGGGGVVYLLIPFGPNVGAHKALFIKAATEQCAVLTLVFVAS